MRISSNQSYLQYRNKLPLIHIKNNTSPSQSGGKAIDYDNLVIDSIFGTDITGKIQFTFLKRISRNELMRHLRYLRNS